MKNLNLSRGQRASVFTVLIGLFLVFIAGNAHAVLLGIIPDQVPDAKSRNTINYYFTNGNDATGGFTMEIDGLVTLLDDGISSTVVDGACAGGLGCYNLDATFNSSGVWQSGTIQLTGTAPSATPIHTSGLLVDGILTNFGWGGNGASGLFEFSFDLLTSDFKDIWSAANGGSVIDTRELAFGAGNLGACDDFVTTDCYVGDWDATSLMTQEFSTAQPPGIFLSGGTTGDTFVPVPAALWLLGSALGLLGFMRRRAVV